MDPEDADAKALLEHLRANFGEARILSASIRKIDPPGPEPAAEED